MKKHCWIKVSASDIAGPAPQPRSGHTAVNIGKSKIVFFGGLVDRRFLNDVTVYDIDNNMWYQPECTGSVSNGIVGPCPRAFHIAVAIDCHMFVFGGRAGANRLGDFWVLDTDLWQWSELTSFGDLPSPRDFAAASTVGNQKIVMYGGWDGKKWLSDVYIMDTISLEWMELSVSGPTPSPRCGHSVSMIEKRLLMYGGRGSGGPIMGDLWALKGLVKEEENETPGWTQLKLPGQAPSARCGHTLTSGGPNLLLFGGHGTGGWLSRYDIYYNECVVLDRVTVLWKRLPTTNEPPAARAYHSMNSVGSRYFLFGGFDGKSTYGDLWWLVPEDDPMAKSSVEAPPKAVLSAHDNTFKRGKDGEELGSAVSALMKRFEISSSPSGVISELGNAEVAQLASQICKNNDPDILEGEEALQAIRDHWFKSTSETITLKELGLLLRDYKLLVYQQMRTAWSNLETGDISAGNTFRFHHMKSASQLRMDDVAALLAEYKQLLSSQR